MPMNQPCDVCCILITQQMHSMPCVVMQLINENQSLIWALAHADVTMHRPSDIPLISLTKTSSLTLSLMYCYVFPFRSFSLSILIFFFSYSICFIRKSKVRPEEDRRGKCAIWKTDFLVQNNSTYQLLGITHLGSGRSRWEIKEIRLCGDKKESNRFRFKMTDNA